MSDKNMIFSLKHKSRWTQARFVKKRVNTLIYSYKSSTPLPSGVDTVNSTISTPSPHESYDQYSFIVASSSDNSVNKSKSVNTTEYEHQDDLGTIIEEIISKAY